MSAASIALIGDYNKKDAAHSAIPKALEFANSALNTKVTWSWVETSTINDKNIHQLDTFSAIWVVPGSPYVNMEGALSAIRFAREKQRPFMGSCGGFQHALIEYALNVCGVSDADHEESCDDKNKSLIVTRLICSLDGKSGEVFFVPNSKLYSIFHGKPTMGEYSCNFGLNPKWKAVLESSGLRFTGFDENQEARAFELPTHPFFIGTLFQPERSALHEEHHPLINAFVAAANNRDK